MSRILGGKFELSGAEVSLQPIIEAVIATVQLAMNAE
jgi:hypothetical protein